jgi:phospholipase C
MPYYPPIANALDKIDHIVVLMFENRSFDHLLGYQALGNPLIDGLANTPSNWQDPSNPNSIEIPVTRATGYGMPFDPGHEFGEVALQLYAPGQPGGPVTMGGFVFSGMETADNFNDAIRVMEGFQPDQIPTLSALAQQFAVVNTWHASLPGPTWPNRFFVHAGTSGGLVDSPSTAQILAGFKFPNGTIFERLQSAQKKWRIYHDGLPQSAGVDYLRPFYLAPLTRQFRDMDEFWDDVGAGDLPEYSFIEPCYDTGNSYISGNSMHPMNDIRKGEALLKQVYEAIRNSKLWTSTLLIITFDEHGGFYDHVAPPVVVPTGDDSRYANPKENFPFTRLGVRVPAILVSAYTQPTTVVGEPGSGAFDHTSILKTVETRFGLAPLTQRDAAARSLEVALNLSIARTDAPTTLPSPLTDAQSTAVATPPLQPQVPADAALSGNQQSLVDLALKCNLEMAHPSLHDGLIADHAAVQTQGDAAQYLTKHQDAVALQRQ